MQGTSLLNSANNPTTLQPPLISAARRDYPKFLRQHIEMVWRLVPISQPDPERCFRVDAALAYCGSKNASSALRQYLYWFQASRDFDMEVVELLIRFFSGPLAEQNVVELMALDMERDCGLSRSQYLEKLLQLRDICIDGNPFANDFDECQFAIGA
ncbi:MAG: hypothetical protein WBN40_05945 [Pseudomonadales bacterium]